VNARIRKVVDGFLELSPNEQELALEEIETAFEREDAPEEVEKAWAEVIERRARDVLAGRSVGRDAFEALDEIRARLAARRR
jgi:Putative addiction module component